MHLDLSQWLFGAAAALLIGLSKTGIPGVGILVVTMLANAFDPRLSVGIMLPMLIFGDCFAVAWYRRHAQWDRLIRLLPWVVFGMALGAAAMWVTGRTKSDKDILDIGIGVLVLVMLAIHLLRGRLGDKLTPRSRAGTASTGAAAGFATTVSNAAGPIMQLYMAAQNVSKEQFMGTIAWYYFIINVAKLPIFGALSIVNPGNPILTGQTLLLDVLMSPGILVGAFAGRWLLPRISQDAFDKIVLVLAAAAAIKLLV